MNYFDRDFDLLKEIQKANAGDINAIHGMLGYIAAEGNDEPDLQELRLKYINTLVEKEDPVGLIILADQFRKGTFGKKEPLEAIKLYQKAVDEGISYGLECIGQMYFLGDGVEIDYQKAYEYLTSRDGNKTPHTDFILGEMYRQGLFLEQDDSKAFDQYLKIVNGENTWMDDYFPMAAYRLAQYWLQNKPEFLSIEDARELAELVHEKIKEPCQVSSDQWITPEMAEALWLQLLRETAEEEM